MHLDMMTMSAVDITATTVLGLVLLFTWLRQRKDRLVGWWSLILLLQAAGLIVVAASALANMPGGVAAGLAVMLLSDSLKWTAAREFIDRPAPLAVSLAGPLVFLIVASSGLTRGLQEHFVLFSVLTAVYNLGAAFEFVRAPGHRRVSHQISYWPSAVLLTVTAAAILFVIPLAGEVPLDNPREAYASGGFAAISLVMVITRIALAFVVLSMTKQRQELKQRINATTDTLTGLPNRRAFYERIEFLQRKRSFRGAPVSILFFDLDHFKNINDTFGHETGDSVLKTFAATASRHLRGYGLTVRIGGEEFAALLPGVEASAAVALAENVRQAFAATPNYCGDVELGATVSVGVASSAETTRKTDDIGALLRQADIALYAAKRAGRNRVELTDRENVISMSGLQIAPWPEHGEGMQDHNAGAVVANV